MTGDHIVLGFVGVGRMGAPMVGNLCRAGYRVRAFDLNAERLRDVAAIDGCTAVSTLSAVSDGARCVITMLPTGATVRTAVLGSSVGTAGGVAAGLDPGCVVIDMSSSAPHDTVRLGEDLAAAGIGLVDAPVSGGVRRAIDGTLTIFVGGEPDLIALAAPVLAALGSTVTRVGGLGTGHAVKALNNLLSATCFAASVEVLSVAERLGLDPRVFIDVVNSSTGRNNATEQKLRQFVLSGSYDSGFALALMAKDIRIARDVAAQSGVDIPVCGEAASRWQHAQRELPENADHTEFARAVR